jgi:hypothetical protein
MRKDMKDLDLRTLVTPRRLILGGAVLGLIHLLLVVLFPIGSAGATVIGFVMALAFLALAAFAGTEARRQGKRPGWAATLPGLAYAVPASGGAFFVHETVTQAKKLMADKGLAHGSPSVTPAQLARLANSPSAHLVEFVTSLILVVVVSIVVGSIAGALRRPSKEDVHAV